MSRSTDRSAGESTDAPAFAGLTISDLEPLSYVRVTRNRRTERHQVFADESLLPLRPGELVFDAGTLLSLGGPKIDAVGVVLRGLKRRNEVYVIEADHYDYKRGGIYSFDVKSSWILKPGSVYLDSDEINTHFRRGQELLKAQRVERRQRDKATREATNPY